MWFWSGRLSPYYAGSAFQNFTMSCRASRARRHLFRRPSRLAPLFALIFLLFAAPAWIAVSRRSFAQTAPPLDYPRLIDITDSTGIHFDHHSSPEQKFIVESMSGGVALIDYDRDGWPDIYFTNAQTVDMVRRGSKSRSALYHNNHDGTFTDVTDRAGVGYPCWANGVSVGDYNHDGWPDLIVTCLSGIVLYRNNGDGTFTDVTKQVGLGGDTLWAAGAAFGDYDNDGWEDLFISHYVDVDLNHLDAFGSRDTCRYMGIDVQCGPRGLKGSPDNLWHNNHDGTFTDVSKKAGVSDPEHRYGLTALWSDFDNDGKLDLFVANDGQPSYLYQGDGAGHFTDVGFTSGIALNANGVAQANMGLALGDYLHSGWMSLFISHFDNEYRGTLSQRRRNGILPRRLSPSAWRTQRAARWAGAMPL